MVETVGIMAFVESILNITPHRGLSLLIWCLVVLLVLYLGRNYVHQFIRAICRAVYNAMRLAATGLLGAEKRITQRNRKLLLAKGMERLERKLERELSQLNAAVVKNTRSYAGLHHQISETIAKIADDHRESMDVPPALPNWKPIIESIAKIEHPGDALVAEMLSEIRRLLDEQHTAAVQSYRRTTHSRHGLLNKMLPRWTQTEKALNRVEQSMSALAARAEKVDVSVRQYRQMQVDTDSAAKAFSMSALTEFITATLFLAVAAGGALVNFDLIAMPLSEITGAGTTIGPFKTATVVAAVITAVELCLGLLLMESLRITRLLPVIGSLEKRLLSRLVWATLILLIVFAGIESALVLLRDQMLADMEALKQSLAGIESTGVSRSAAPMAAHMALGFILPFWIALSAIPFASFVATARTLAGSLAEALLRLVAFCLRLLGQAFVSAGKILAAAYDLIIFPTLWLEATLSGLPHKSKPSAKAKPRYGFLRRSKNRPENQEPSGQLKESP